MRQSLPQRKRAAGAAAKWSPPGGTVTVHVGVRSANHAVELAGRASRIGARAIGSLTPIGNCGFNKVRACYAPPAAASDAPFLICYSPAFASTIASIDQSADLRGIPDAAGLWMGGGFGGYHNLVPEAFVQLYELARAKASTGQQAVNEPVAIGLRFPGRPAVNAMLSWPGIGCDRGRAPRRAQTTREQSGFRALLSTGVGKC